MKVITREYLEKINACLPALEWFSRKYPEGKELKLLKKDALYNSSWSSWLITHILNREDCIRYAIFAAKQVIHIFEKKYPEDLRPRKAIEAAENYLNNPDAAYAAAAAAADAADAAYAAAYAAYYAAYYADAAYYAAYAAYYAAYAAYAADAADAAYYAAYAVYAAAYAAYSAYEKNKMKLIILEYGLKLIYEGDYVI